MTRQQGKAQNPEYTIILYYKYTKVDEPQKLVDCQKLLCERLNLKGRIIISHEGINGTLEGAQASIARYCEELKQDERFADISFKKSVGTGCAFPRLSIKLRQEIVSGHLSEIKDDIDPTQLTGKRLSPNELQKWFSENRDFAIIDMRNQYEHEVGHFKGSILPEMHNFRDLPQAIDGLNALPELKQKTVLTVCTGGVRCEKASGYLLKNGFKDVYQLDGGIVSYMEKYPTGNFLGSLYVFDGRVTMHFDRPEDHKVIGKCALCTTSSERYADCKDDNCHEHFICCENCLDNEGKALCLRCKVIK